MESESLFRSKGTVRLKVVELSRPNSFQKNRPDISPTVRRRIEQNRFGWIRIFRLVIEEEIRTYIRDKAEASGLEIVSAEPSLRWSTEGLWIPDSVSILFAGTDSAKTALAKRLEAELGIPLERQQWNENG